MSQDPFLEVFNVFWGRDGVHIISNHYIISISLMYTYRYVHRYLVGGFIHLQKYEFVNGKDDIPFLLWKINTV